MNTNRLHLPCLLVIWLLMSGCGVRRAYHGVIYLNQKSAAIENKQVINAIVLSRSPISQAALNSIRLVSVRARDASEISQNSNGSAGMPADHRVVLETHLERALIQKGYRCVSRLSARQMSEDKSVDIESRESTSPHLKPSHFLLLSMMPEKPEKVTHDWESLGSSHNWKIGTRVSYNLALELIDTKSSEVLWTSTARLNAILRDQPDHWKIVESMVETLIREFPGNPITLTARH